MRSTGTVIGIILVVLLLVGLFGGAGMMGFGGFGMGGMMSGFGMHGLGSPYGIGFNPLGWILSLVIWALIIGGIVLFVVWLARSAGQTSGGKFVGDSPLDILKARYAKGEITKEQFNEMSQDLQA